MLETREAPSPEREDRHLRDEFEHLQAERRRLRGHRECLPELLATEEQALHAAIAAAKTRQEAAEAELKALKREGDELEVRLEKLGAQLEARKKEAEVLARGERRRGRYIEWWSTARRQRYLALRPRPKPWVVVLAWFLLAAMVGFYLAMTFWR